VHVGSCDYTSEQFYIFYVYSVVIGIQFAVTDELNTLTENDF